MTALRVKFLYPSNLGLRSKNIDIESIDKHPTILHCPSEERIDKFEYPIVVSDSQC